MGQLQFFRDYSLEFKSSNGANILTITNSHDKGIGLRIYFNIALNSPGDPSLSASTSTSHPAHFRIYNLSAEHHNRITNGELNSITFNAGYRDSVNGGNSNKALLISDGTILNSVTYRTGPDIVTDIYTLTSKTKSDKKIDKEDQTKYRKQYVTKKFYSDKEIFTYFIKKYLPKAIILPRNIKALTDKKDSGYTFKAGTSVIQALDMIANKNHFYLDALNYVHVLAPGDDDLSDVPRIEINQTTGLLGVPIVGPSGRITVTTLLNPLITPLSVVHISTVLGFAQAGVLVKTSLLPIREQIARVNTVTIIGDSRGGAWQTRFITQPVPGASQ